MRASINKGSERNEVESCECGPKPFVITHQPAKATASGLPSSLTIRSLEKFATRSERFNLLRTEEPQPPLLPS